MLRLEVVFHTGSGSALNTSLSDLLVIRYHVRTSGIKILPTRTTNQLNPPPTVGSKPQWEQDTDSDRG